MSRRRTHASLIMTTTAIVQGRPVADYLGLVTGEAIVGANVVRDVLAGFRDFIGGRSTSYERMLDKARGQALQAMEDQAGDLGADAVIGIDIDFGTMGPHGSLVMVAASGTAVKLGPEGGSATVVRRV